MNRQERLAALLDLVVERKNIRIDEIVAVQGVSPATARRDLDDLASQQLLTRTRGGAMVNPTTGEVPMRFRTVRNNDEKTRIAKAALKLLSAGQVVAMNGGTTTTTIAAEIATWMGSEYGYANDAITVVTNAVNIANDLAIRPQVRVVVTGGVARARSYELVGPLAALIYPHIIVDIAFLGVNAISADGFYTDNDSEATANRALVNMAKRTFVVADSSKIGTTAFAKVANIDKIAGLITDRGIAPSSKAIFERHGLQVIVA